VRGQGSNEFGRLDDDVEERAASSTHPLALRCQVGLEAGDARVPRLTADARFLALPDSAWGVQEAAPGVGSRQPLVSGPIAEAPAPGGSTASVSRPPWAGWAGKDTDVGAVIGSCADERQTSPEMKVTPLPGKVMTAAAVVAFLIAVAVKATFWPFAVFVVPAGVSGLAGWAIYREDGNGHDDGMDAEHAQSPIRVKPGP